MSGSKKGHATQAPVRNEMPTAQEVEQVFRLAGLGGQDASLPAAPSVPTTRVKHGRSDPYSYELTWGSRPIRDSAYR